MLDLSCTIWMITLNENGLNNILKGRDCQMRFKKQDPTRYWLHETNLKYRDSNRLKVKRMEKNILCQPNQKKAGIVILTLNKAEFKWRNVIREKVISWNTKESIPKHSCIQLYSFKTQEARIKKTAKGNGKTCNFREILIVLFQ